MLTRRLYYTAKPFLPWRLRMGVRRLFAARLRRKVAHMWPVDPAAATPPSGWTGWPHGKKFAVVLTHDVEGPEGLAKCRQLAELERELGFRSSFNFIPEGAYRVQPELRHWLTEQGFEVGVHDLEHNGKLFDSRSVFARKAVRINHFLREWNACGFRAGFMLRNLEWYHQLDIAYDASTFDTDPFEPQPGAASTIFPHWISAPADSGRPGYLELPYTLPQDSTLFLLLREKTPQIWLDKLDWLAGHGGMVLVNVHPDYMNFSNTPGTAREFPASLYAGLLQTMRHKYADQFWNPTARELAGWYAQTHRPPAAAPSALPTASASPVEGRLSDKRMAVLLYSQYPSDPRPRRAAEAAHEAGMAVDLFCITESEDEPREETVRGVNVFRLPLKRIRDNKWAYFWLYGKFLLASFWFLTRKGLRRKYDVVHVHNMPDFLVFAALLPKLRGARVILDLHDPMPELMVTIYQLSADQWQVRVLRLLERLSIGFANLALTPNIAFKKLFVSRGCPPEKMQIVMNTPQPEIFDPDRYGADETGPASAGTFRIMHHGSIVHRHGIDLLVEAVARLRPRIPGVVLDIYGMRTPFLDTVLALAARLGIGDCVRYHGPKNQHDIAAAIRDCHVGVVPNRRSQFTETNFPTRLFEYLSIHRPVIAPSTAGIRDYFDDRQMLYFEPGDVADLANRLLWVYEHPEETKAIVRQGTLVYRQHLWREEKIRFVDMVRNLCAKS